MGQQLILTQKMKSMELDQFTMLDMFNEKL